MKLNFQSECVQEFGVEEEPQLRTERTARAVRRTLKDSASRPSARRPIDEVVCHDRMLALLRKGGDLRKDKIAQVSDAIWAEEYDSKFKLEIALDRMIDAVNEL